MVDIKKLYKQYSLNTYTRVGPVFVKGKGSWLWDDKGDKYLDLFPGWGVSILGHCNPRIARALAEQSRKLIHLPNNLYQEEQVLLAKKIVASSFGGKVFFANSGAEAVEAAIKFSRLFGQGKKYEVITMKKSFHGRTFAAMSATAQKKYKDVFKPLVPGFREAEFNNFVSFKSKVNSKTAAVILELIQGEGGVNIAGRDYLKKMRQYCDKHKILLIVDEVQTGMGRTGKMFAFQNYRVKPDVMLLSKGLGGGFPISAMVVANRFTHLIKPGMHASTFGGSSLATRSGLETFKAIEKDITFGRIRLMSKFLEGKLKGLKNKFSFVKDARISGLMSGLELKIESFPIFSDCLKKKLIINSTQGRVLRIMPALNVSKAELNKGFEIIEEVLNKHR